MAVGNYDITYFTEVESKKVDWLWYPYIPYGKLTILQGDPGDGKTTFILSLIALLSNGEHLPFSDTKVSGISIYQNAEDDISDTIKPRLEWHKANCKKICFIDSKDTPLFMDNDNIEKAIRETGAKLLVLDPIQSFIGNNVDMNRANSIRPLMTKLKDTAQHGKIKYIVVTHFSVIHPNLGILQKFADKLKGMGCGIVSLHERVNTLYLNDTIRNTILPKANNT